MGDIINYDIDNVVRGRIVSVSNKLMMKNLVVSELLSIFAMLFEHRIFEHRISEQECDISPILLAWYRGFFVLISNFDAFKNTIFRGNYIQLYTIFLQKYIFVYMKA